METLRQLMSAYFHQDWSDEYGGTWQVAVDDFIRREPDRLSALKLELAELLDSTTDDAALGARLDALGSYYWPGDAAHAHREWVTAIRDHVTSATGGGPA
jgi:hypothetical protein